MKNEVENIIFQKTKEEKLEFGEPLVILVKQAYICMKKILMKYLHQCYERCNA